MSFQNLVNLRFALYAAKLSSVIWCAHYILHFSSYLFQSKFYSSLSVVSTYFQNNFWGFANGHVSRSWQSKNGQRFAPDQLAANLFSLRNTSLLLRKKNGRVLCPRRKVCKHYYEFLTAVDNRKQIKLCGMLSVTASCQIEAKH